MGVLLAVDVASGVCSRMLSESVFVMLQVNMYDKWLGGIMMIFRVRVLCMGGYFGLTVNSTCKTKISRFLKMEQSHSHVKGSRSQADACIIFLNKE